MPAEAIGPRPPQATAPVPSPRTPEPTGATRDPVGVVATLRRMIGDGRYSAGERMAEIAVAQALGVSRTPVRLAFRTLEQEGLLRKAGARGYVVREFSDADVRCAVDVRGVLEGLAARRLAEAGIDEAVHAELLDCLRGGDAVLSRGRLGDDEVGAWSRVNERFHRAIVGAAGSAVIADAIARNDHLPFASADSIAIDHGALEREYRKLCVAQMHHRLIVEAIERRESARVEALMREHARIGLGYGGLWAAADPSA